MGQCGTSLILNIRKLHRCYIHFHISVTNNLYLWKIFGKYFFPFNFILFIYLRSRSNK